MGVKLTGCTLHQTYANLHMVTLFAGLTLHKSKQLQNWQNYIGYLACVLLVRQKARNCYGDHAKPDPFRYLHKGGQERGHIWECQNNNRDHKCYR